MELRSKLAARAGIEWPAALTRTVGAVENPRLDWGSNRHQLNYPYTHKSLFDDLKPLTH